MDVFSSINFYTLLSKSLIFVKLVPLIVNMFRLSFNLVFQSRFRIVFVSCIDFISFPPVHVLRFLGCEPRDIYDGGKQYKRKVNLAVLVRLTRKSSDLGLSQFTMVESM